MIFILGEVILDLTHLPIGAKLAKKCTADMVMSAKHPSVHLFETKRTSGMIILLIVFNFSRIFRLVANDCSKERR
jgi:hypothetical protein